MKYLLLIYMEEQALSQEERQHCYVESTELAHELQAKGQFLATAPLQPTSTSTSVRVREGKRLVIQTARFAETREHLGGFFMVDARDLDEAISIARPDSRGARGDGRDPPRGWKSRACRDNRNNGAPRNGMDREPGDRLV